MKGNAVRIQRNLGFWLATGAVAIMALIILAYRNPPTLGDYVEWVYHGVLLRDFLQNHPNNAYFLKNYPVPNSLTTIGLAFLMLLVPWKMAAKLWLVFGMFLGLFSAYRLQQASGNRQHWQIIVITAAALVGIGFWWGFINFLFGIYLTMFFCSLLLQDKKSKWIYGILLVLIFFSHMIAFGFALCALGLYVIQTRRWQFLWQTIPAIALCAWYFVGRFTHSDIDSTAGMQASVPYASWLFIIYKLNTYLKCWGFVNPASNFHDSILLRLAGSTWFIFLFALNAMVALIVLVMLAKTATKAVREKTSDRFFWQTVSLFFIFGLLMPGAAAGISDPGGRMLQIAVWCAVCVVTTRKQWAGETLAFCAIVLSGFNLYQMAVIGEKPPIQGSLNGPLPARIREFGHVYYAGRTGYYDSIDRGQMNLDIYPTAMFLKKPMP